MFEQFKSLDNTLNFLLHPAKASLKKLELSQFKQLDITYHELDLIEFFPRILSNSGIEKIPNDLHKKRLFIDQENFTRIRLIALEFSQGLLVFDVTDHSTRRNCGERNVVQRCFGFTGTNCKLPCKQFEIYISNCSTSLVRTTRTAQDGASFDYYVLPQQKKI